MKAKIFMLILMTLVISLAACANHQVVQQALPAAQVPAPQKPIKYVIMPGDELDIRFFYNPELNESVTVRPDGMISLQLVDEIQAAGLEPAELDDILTGKYGQELRKPVITVIVRSFTGQRIYVGGEVIRQGLLTLAPGMTPLQAVFQAGGFMETAQPSETIVIRKGADNRPTPIKVDLAGAIYGGGQDANFQLMPDDVIYVPKSAIAKANKFVNQYIEQLFLFRGVSLGFSYELHSDQNSN